MASRARPGGQQSNFGNNLSIFDWIFGTARLHDQEPAEFGIDDRSFPEGNLVKQFFFAFRRQPPAAEPRRADAAASEPASPAA